MGIYDRGYYGDQRSAAWSGQRSMVVTLILVNVGIYLADWLSGDQLSPRLRLNGDLLAWPWQFDHLLQFYQFLTYGFVHSRDLPHILFNMFGLWLFGTEVEQVYGRAEFLRIYLLTIVFSGLVYAVVGVVTGVHAPLVGASGGVMGIMILYVLNFPQRTLYIWGIVPIRAWLLGALYVFFDVMGAMNQNDNVAHVAHLSGVAFGFLYFRGGWNLGRLVPSRLSWATFKLRPRLRIHDPQSEAHNLNEQVDQILAKISRQGEASLTKKERRTLEEASRRYQQRRE